MSGIEIQDKESLTNQDEWECSSEVSFLSADFSWPEENEAPRIGNAAASYPSRGLGLQSEEIRLLHLQPAVCLQASLVAYLRMFSLNDPILPSYEALSYAWGFSAAEEDLLVNGVSMPLRSNVHNALRRLRRPDRPRVLWIDAICINQEDPAERGHQVNLMSRVYSSAACVLVWLGESNIPRPEQEANDRVSMSSLTPAMIVEDHRRRSLISSITTTESRWWERAWVRQEVVLAASDPTFIFGQYTMPWHELETYLRTFDQNVEVVGLSKCLGFIQALKTRYLREGIRIVGAFEMTRDTKASDCRDKVYSMLGYLSHNARSVIRPDYTLSCDMVFRHALPACALEEHDFDLFLRYRAKRIAENGERDPFVTSDDDHESTPQWARDLCNGDRALEWTIDGGTGVKLSVWKICAGPLQSGTQEYKGGDMVCTGWKTSEVKASWGFNAASEVIESGERGSIFDLCNGRDPLVAFLDVMCETLETSPSGHLARMNVTSAFDAMHQSALIQETETSHERSLRTSSTKLERTEELDLFKFFALFMSCTTAGIQLHDIIGMWPAVDDKAAEGSTSARHHWNKSYLEAVRDVLQLEYREALISAVCCTPKQRQELLMSGNQEMSSNPIGSLVDDISSFYEEFLAPFHYTEPPQRFRQAKHFFYTREGLVGTASTIVSSGDVVALHDPHMMPLVFRPHGGYWEPLCYCSFLQLLVVGGEMVCFVRKPTESVQLMEQTFIVR